jgi:integrase/recombinase XerC
VKSYLTAARQLAAFGAARGRGDALATYGKALIKDFLIHIIETRSPSTAQTRYDGLRACYRWLEDEEPELAGKPSPLTKVKRPDAPDPETPVIPLEQVSKLLAVCDRSTTQGARDRAIIRLLLDIGPRADGVAGIKLDDVDLDNQLVWIELKRAKRKSKRKGLPFGDKEAADLERYLRRRRLSPFAHLPWLWLGLRGRFTASGIAQMLTSHAEQAGLGIHIHPHMFRHTFAHYWKQSEGKDEEVAELGDWQDPRMFRRYGKLLSEERAIAAHRRLSPGDRV